MLLELKDVSKTFQRQSTSFSPVDHLNFGLDQGDFVVISGRSGAGKTTLFNLIACLDQPTTGEIIFDNRSVAQQNVDEQAHYRNEDLGYLVQHPTLIESLTVLENVVLPFYLQERSGDVESRALHLLEDLGVAYLKDDSVTALSGGELKRVALARALINQPALVLVDEPTSDLDEDSAQTMIDYLVQLNAGGTAIMAISHDPAVLNLDLTHYRYTEGQLHPIKIKME